MAIGDGLVAFDEARLDACLRAHVHGLAGRMTVARIAGGQSNPTYFVDYDNRRMVLRKQRPGPPLLAFHFVFAMFRFAVIFEGIAARVRAGTAAAGDAADTAHLPAAFARHALAAIGGPPPYSAGDSA